MRSARRWFRGWRLGRSLLWYIRRDVAECLDVCLLGQWLALHIGLFCLDARTKRLRLMAQTLELGHLSEHALLVPLALTVARMHRKLVRLGRVLNSRLNLVGPVSAVAFVDPMRD